MKIGHFAGKYGFLSNFWPAAVRLDGALFTTVEHAYQASKTLDIAWRGHIQRTVRPGDVKRIGRHMPMRHDWKDIKLDVMLGLLRQKFSHAPLAAELLATGDAELIEGNWWRDRYWGVYLGVGENHLGRLLMQVRHELRNDL